MARFWRRRRRGILLLGGLLAGLGAGTVVGYRETSGIIEGLLISHPEDPRDGVTFIFYGMVFLGGIVGLGAGWLAGILMGGTPGRDAEAV